MRSIDIWVLTRRDGCWHPRDGYLFGQYRHLAGHFQVVAGELELNYECNLMHWSPEDFKSKLQRRYLICQLHWCMRYEREKIGRASDQLVKFLKHILFNCSLFLSAIIERYQLLVAPCADYVS
ncbi:uncharacterized protein LOC116106029 isoform X1 [Pistacia vera]|uniref:uncharacterized protein LOC116106029 isoform X1 n=1 Tax=Pistacia vera TaxID=55513 RepID=UPI001262EA6F|nr:uncharacterized protein LOC116106029 isoform X1 [Pistacia vera]